MPATMGTADALLKEIAEPSIQRLLNDETPILDRFEKSSKGITTDSGNNGGKYVKFVIHLKRNTGVGARKEGEDLPAPGQQSYSSGQVNLAYLYGSIQVTGQVTRLADSDQEAYLSVVDDEMSRLPSDLGVDLNRQIWSDGTGKLGSTTTVGANATATIAGYDARNFQEGMYVDVFTSAAFASNVAGTPTAAKAQAYVDTVTPAVQGSPGTGTVTFTSSVTWASGDVITRQGNVAREVLGLAAIVSDTGTIFNINPTTVPKWKSLVDTNSGTNRPISEAMLRVNYDTVRVNGGKVDLIVWGLGVSRAYANLLQQNRQVVNQTELQGGYKSLAFATGNGNVELMDDWTAPPNTVWGLSTKDLKVYQEMDWGWWDEDGHIWRQIYGTNGQIKDMKSALMYKYMQLGAHKRNTHFLIKDVVES